MPESTQTAHIGVHTDRHPPFLDGSRFAVRECCAHYDIGLDTLGRMAGFSEPSIEQWAKAAAPKTPAPKQLVETLRLLDALTDLMESGEIGVWLQAPNNAFGGSSPLQLIERGETERLWKMHYLVQSGEPV